MPRSEVIHAVQGITEFSDAFIDDNYKISDDKYYGNGGKRKRKTSAPQKREVSEDESAESDKGGESSSTGEPINLMKKDPKILRSPESRSEHREDSEQKFWTSSVEQSRMYTTLLNYLLLKYQATSSFKGDSYGATGEHFSPSERPHHPIAFPSSSPGNASTHQFPSTSSSLGHSTLPETNMAQNNCTHPPIKGDQPPRNLFYRCPPSNELSWKQSIVHAISTCIHNIPIPKTGYVNYEAMLLCYKNLIEKAYALQQSIDLYLNLLQASPITDKSSPVNGVSAPINGISMHGKIYHTPFSNPQPPLLNYYHNASSNLAAALCDAQKILTAQASMYPTTGQWYNNEGLLKHRNGGSAHSGSDEEHSCTNDSMDQYPVDLTNSSSRFALHSPQTKDLPACPELPHKSGGSSKNEVSNVFSQFASSQSSDQQSRLPSNGSNSEYEPLHSSNDKFEFAFTSVTDKSCINSFRRAVSSEMTGNNILSGPLRMSFNQRKKAYFKTKRLRKSLSSSSSVNEKSFSEEGGSPVKKSNFRGTSEEENKVSPDFKPIEINLSALNTLHPLESE
ncbi:unnamed protein product [Calicophoron daubneyi]|uniref:Uncharacterized protein n=1 Tax=Calicophoron daubneyi TaxID=300641 RepID=A0AAV2TQ51_CALDB